MWTWANCSISHVLFPHVRIVMIITAPASQGCCSCKSFTKCWCALTSLSSGLSPLRWWQRPTSSSTASAFSYQHFLSAQDTWSINSSCWLHEVVIFISSVSWNWYCFLKSAGNIYYIVLENEFLFSPLTYLSLLFGLRVDCGWHTIVISEECAVNIKRKKFRGIPSQVPACIYFNSSFSWIRHWECHLTSDRFCLSSITWGLKHIP